MLDTVTVTSDTAYPSGTGFELQLLDDPEQPQDGAQPPHSAPQGRLAVSAIEQQADNAERQARRRESATFTQGMLVGEHAALAQAPAHQRPQPADDGATRLGLIADLAEALDYELASARRALVAGDLVTLTQATSGVVAALRGLQQVRATLPPTAHSRLAAFVQRQLQPVQAARRRADRIEAAAQPRLKPQAAQQQQQAA